MKTKIIGGLIASITAVILMALIQLKQFQEVQSNIIFAFAIVLIMTFLGMQIADVLEDDNDKKNFKRTKNKPIIIDSHK